MIDLIKFLILFLILFLFMLILPILGAYNHEKDIIKQCKENGRSGNASWVNELSCRPIESN